MEKAHRVRSRPAYLFSYGEHQVTLDQIHGLLDLIVNPASAARRIVAANSTNHQTHSLATADDISEVTRNLMLISSLAILHMQ